jgi:hypothetical protein
MQPTRSQPHAERKSAARAMMHFRNRFDERAANFRVSELEWQLAIDSLKGCLNFKEFSRSVETLSIQMF